jgi:hypothetical protein
MRCAAITRAGERCKLEATSGSYCWSHALENAEERKRRAQRGGRARAGAGGELEEIKRRLSDLADDVLKGRVERGTGAVVSQVLNVYLRAVSVELKVREELELVARLEALENALQPHRGGGSRWGA